MLLALSVGACGSPPATAPQSSESIDTTPRPAPIFRDQAAASGLKFVYDNGMSGALHLPEIVGSGGALLDFDGDGDLDLYLVQGGVLDPDAPMASADARTDRLYRNDLDRGDGLRFVDVTAASGLAARGAGDGYGMGAAAGDFDNDGRVDLYVTALGSNRLLHNRGDGTFEDVTRTAGAADSGWSVPGAFFDADGDGWLDLFVGNYVNFDLRRQRPCYGDSGALDYCGPLAFAPAANRLLRNRGDGTFEDVTRAAGLQIDAGATLGVSAADFNGDGRVDLYVANDAYANRLWLNRGAVDGRRLQFEDDAPLAGSAVNAEGLAEAGMGVAVGDIDGDGDRDLLLSHLTGETNTLYRNDGDGFFRDATVELGLGAPSWPFTGFGTGFIDFENDGQLDLLVVNGAVKAIEALIGQGDPYPLHEPNQIFANRGDRGFEDVTATAAEAVGQSAVSRGAIFGDIDNDGDTDVVVVNSQAPAQLLINQIGQQAHWIGLRLVLAAAPRDALGARVRIEAPGAPSRWRWVDRSGSYASSHDPRVLAGLGAADGPADVEVLWPDGTREAWDAVPVDRYTTLHQGTGKALP